MIRWPPFLWRCCVLGADRFSRPAVGVVADRYSRKWLIVGGNAIRGLVLILFGWYFHHSLSAHLIYLLMTLLGIGFAVYLPATIALIRDCDFGRFAVRQFDDRYRL